MNFFPYMLDFKNLNQYNFPYSLQYGMPCPFYNPNQITLNECQFTPSFWTGNNDFIQNLKDQKQPELINQFQWKVLSCSKQQEAQITQEIKNVQQKEKKEKKVFKQKEGRNMISNLFRQALKCMVIQKDKYIELIDKISQKQKIQINGREFIENISKKLKNLKNYVRIGQIQSFLKGKENGKSKQHAKVLRILVNKFLREEVITCLSNNPKVQNSNRMIHILERRKFQELLSL